MKIKSFLAKPFANYIYKQVKKGMETAVQDQQYIFNHLMKDAAKTVFGKEHQFELIKSHQDFVKQVPIRDYEAFKPYIEKIKQGKHNILWKGQPIYFAKTSGTTSGVKYIPITKDSIPNHINTARNALLCYMAETGNTGVPAWEYHSMNWEKSALPASAKHWTIPLKEPSRSNRRRPRRESAGK